MKRIFVRLRLSFGVLPLLLAIILLTACGGPATPPDPVVGSTPTPTPTPEAIDALPTDFDPGEQDCPAPIQEISYWSTILTTEGEIGRIHCAHLRGDDTLQAVILVGYEGTGKYIDVYVYDHITEGVPQEILKLESLAVGDVKISAHSTLLTAEVDTESEINQGQPTIALQVDLFREFGWDSATSTLVPVAYPGFYPDMTRWQAVESQSLVESGSDAWRLDINEVVTRYADEALGWSDPTVEVVSGGSESDTEALVNVTTDAPGSYALNVTLTRFQGIPGNIWAITRVESEASGTTIATPQEYESLSSPVSVEGMTRAFEGHGGEVYVFDHLYEIIGSEPVVPAEGNGEVSYTASVNYTSTFVNGHQEGILALITESNADGGLASAVMIKVLLT